MGGIRTDHRGQSPWLQGLFACGEVACWDLHGFNRLGGNSVAETVVAGMLVGEYVADFCDSHAGQIQISSALAQDFLRREQAHLDRLLAGPGQEDAIAIRQAMERVMTNQVGLFRTGPDLEAAVTELRELLARAHRLGVRNPHPGANPELVLAYRLPRMLKVALGAALGALARTESRGAHYREDFPGRNDRDWLKRTLLHWPEGADLPVLDYEPLDVRAMELPPGFRGYGARNILDHPDTAHRQAEVDALRGAGGEGDGNSADADPAAIRTAQGEEMISAQTGQTTGGIATGVSASSNQASFKSVLTSQADQAPSLQDRLMPFHHLLPARYQGPNARSSAPESVQPPSPQPSPSRGGGSE